MNRFHGPIKNKQQADALAAKLEKVGLSEADDAAKMLRRNWQSVAARPFMAAKMIALADSEPPSVEREGSVLHAIMKRKTS